MNATTQPAPPPGAIGWHEYGDAAFALAARLNRPILIDLGAVWCHWCHVMDRTTYEDPEVIALIRERFVAVRVDRDRRPDVDRRFQQAVAAYQVQLTGRSSGGWPLTAFLTAQGGLIHGETYMPPERFLQVATAVADAYRDRRGEIDRHEEVLQEMLAQRRPASVPASQAVVAGAADALIADLKAQFDARHGGFGGAPKFPAPTAVQFLIQAAGDRAEPDLLGMALKTLTAMAAGGLRDHVGGGFHRYSVDARWVVPHFEKMLDVNAGMLDNYLDLARAADTPLARDAAAETVRFLDEVLSDRERGGFYGSQDADVGLHDDGAYFTWSLKDFQAAVPPDALPIATAYFGVNELGDMEEFDGLARRPTGQNVLHATKTIEQAAALEKTTPEAARAAVDRALAALRAARAKRSAPAVDRTILVDWNAAAVRAYLKAAAVLDRPDCRAFALKTVDRLLAEAYDPKRGMAHYLPPAAEGGNGGEGGMARFIPPEGSAKMGSDPRTAKSLMSFRWGLTPFSPNPEAAGYGLLADNVGFAAALLDAYEATGERRYLDVARSLMDLVLATLWDEGNGGFFDAAAAPDAVGILKQRSKDVQDQSRPSGNALADDTLLRLAEHTGETAYRDRAERALASLGDLPTHLSCFGAALVLAIDRLTGPPAHLVVVGALEDDRARALHRAALAANVSRRTVQVLDPSRDADLLTRLGLTPPSRPALLVCGRGLCLEPVFDPADLPARLAALSERSGPAGVSRS